MTALSAQARDRLGHFFDKTCLSWKGGFTLNDVLREIGEVFEHSASFSEQIVTNGEVKRRCNLGHLHCIYRLTFRVILLPALRILAVPATLLSTPELVNACEDPNVGRMVGKYVRELMHFGLIGQLTDGRYWLTERGHGFLSGKVAIPAWTWPRDEKLPEECVDGPPRFIQELADEHPKEDKGFHVEMAVAIPSSSDQVEPIADTGDYRHRRFPSAR